MAIEFAKHASTPTKKLFRQPLAPLFPCGVINHRPEK